MARRSEAAPHFQRVAEQSTRLIPANASVAQLVEQLTLNQLVLGSSPSRGTPLKALILKGLGLFHFDRVSPLCPYHARIFRGDG